MVNSTLVSCLLAAQMFQQIRSMSQRFLRFFPAASSKPPDGHEKKGALPMIVTLRVECVTGRFLEAECVRVIEMDENDTLTSLHAAILSSVGFDFDHLYEFFVGRHIRHRAVDFEDAFGNVLNDGGLDEITLSRVYPLPKKCKLFYHYDFGDDWYFEIRKSRTKPVPPKPDVSYPRLVQKVGPDPDQYPDDI